jgi:hypothetical protein
MIPLHEIEICKFLSTATRHSIESMERMSVETVGMCQIIPFRFHRTFHKYRYGVLARIFKQRMKQKRGGEQKGQK